MALQMVPSGAETAVNVLIAQLTVDSGAFTLDVQTKQGPVTTLITADGNSATYPIIISSFPKSMNLEQAEAEVSNYFKERLGHLFP